MLNFIIIRIYRVKGNTQIFSLNGHRKTITTSRPPLARPEPRYLRPGTVNIAQMNQIFSTAHALRRILDERLRLRDVNLGLLKREQVIYKKVKSL